MLEFFRSIFDTHKDLVGFRAQAPSLCLAVDVEDIGVGRIYFGAEGRVGQGLSLEDQLFLH